MEENNAEDIRGWAAMLPEALILIFRKLSLEDMIMSVPLVCWAWNRASLDPLCWECVDLRGWAYNYATFTEDDERMVRFVVDRSCGRLREFSLRDFGTDGMLCYISARCSSLKCLRLTNCSEVTDSAFCKVAYKFSELEELDISGCNKLSELTLQEVGHCCKTLKWLQRCGSDIGNIPSNEEALTIARSMPHLRHLEMRETQISNEGLLALLEGCSDLEYLDLRSCDNLTIETTTAEKCSKLKCFYASIDLDICEDYDTWDDCMDDDDYWTD